MSATTIITKVNLYPDIGTNDSTYVAQIVAMVRAWLCDRLRLPTFPDGDGGVSTSAASPATDLESANGTKFWISVDFTSAVEVTLTLAGLTSGSLIAAELQTQIRAAVDSTDPRYSVFQNITATYTNSLYVITSPTRTDKSSIRISWQSDEPWIALELKLGMLWGGVEDRGSSFSENLEDHAVEMSAAVYRAIKLAPEGYKTANAKQAALRDAIGEVLQGRKWPAVYDYARLGF